MTGPSPRFRAGAFLLVALAVLTGVMSRMVIGGSDAAVFVGVESLSLSLGQPFGQVTSTELSVMTCRPSA
jgi:hypothetical protein